MTRNVRAEDTDVDDATAAEEGEWVVVARTANMAEAGYFQALLDEKGVPAQIHKGRRSVRGRRSPELAVPADRADRAAAFLTEEASKAPHADRVIPEQEFRPAPRPADADADGHRLWRAVLVAGAVAAMGVAVLRQLALTP